MPAHMTVYFDHFRHWFHHGGTTAAAAAKAEIDCNSKTAGCRAKRMKIWALWGAVDTSQHVNYDHFKQWFHSDGPHAKIVFFFKTACHRAKIRLI